MVVRLSFTFLMASNLLPVASTSITTSGRGGIRGVCTVLATVAEAPGASGTSTAAGVTAEAGSTVITAVSEPVLPARSVAVQVTVVSPIGNSDPGGGVQAGV